MTEETRIRRIRDEEHLSAVAEVLRDVPGREKPRSEILSRTMLAVGDGDVDEALRTFRSWGYFPDPPTMRNNESTYKFNSVGLRETGIALGVVD